MKGAHMRSRFSFAARSAARSSDALSASWADQSTTRASPSFTSSRPTFPAGWSTVPNAAPDLSTPCSTTWTDRLSSRDSTKKRAWWEAGMGCGSEARGEKRAE